MQKVFKWFKMHRMLSWICSSKQQMWFVLIFVCDTKLKTQNVVRNCQQRTTFVQNAKMVSFFEMERVLLWKKKTVQQQMGLNAHRVLMEVFLNGDIASVCCLFFWHKEQSRNNNCYEKDDKYNVRVNGSCYGFCEKTTMTNRKGINALCFATNQKWIWKNILQHVWNQISCDS